MLPITARSQGIADVFAPRMGMQGVQSATIAALGSTGITPFIFTDETGRERPVPVLAIYVTALTYLRFTANGGDTATFADIWLYPNMQNRVGQPQNITAANFIRLTSPAGCDFTIIPCEN